jgi:hypothetical protein
MTGRIRLALSLLALTFALSVAACADSTAPQAPVLDQNHPWTQTVGCDQNNPWTSC